MYRTDRPRNLLRTLVRLLAATVLLLPATGLAEHASLQAERTAASPVPPPRRPNRKKAAGEPVRLAVLTVAVHTPIFVQAYERFCKLHGKEKLIVDLWIEQQWAESPRPLKFEDYDMIFALRCSIPGLEKAVAEAAHEGTWVVSHSSLKYGDCSVPIDRVPELAPYYRQRGVANMVGFFEKVCELFHVPGIQARQPVEVPIEGIYHPDAEKVFPDAESYWKWYAGHPSFKPGAPKIGIFVYNTLYLNEETDYFAQLVRGIEQAGANPVLGFWFLPVDGDDRATSPIERFFTGVDVLISSSFRLMHEKPWHYESLQRLDVPVLNSIILNVSREQWRLSRQGIPAGYLLPGIVNPETAGLIEPVVIATRQPVTNPETKQQYFRSVVIEENYQWQIRRALAWAKLRHKQPQQRRVAILFYNHSGGKHNVGASYLNVTASLEAILAALARSGYRVEGDMDRQAIIDSMLSVGRNVGNWAPGQIDRLVENGAVLWPVEEYLAHYDRLPAEAKRQICRQWGQPPGRIMTVTRQGRQYFVLPVFQLGNILLAPQPARATSQEQASLYHDPLTWPTHQYLAFYFWLQHQWKADAVVHLGRHGTLEFLPGKSIGLACDDPPALVLGHLPNVYPYIVDGIGEAVAAKRRGQAVILTHATPPLCTTKLYGALAELQRAIDGYTSAGEQRQSSLRTEYYKSIVKLATGLGYQAAVVGEVNHEDRQPKGNVDGGGNPAADLPASAEDREVERIEQWLSQIEAQTGPRGLHTLGQSYSAEATEQMLRRMFADELATLHTTGTVSDQQAWLAHVAEAAAAEPPAAPAAEAATNTVANTAAEMEAVRRRIEWTAWQMRHNREIDSVLHALDGGFVPVGPPGDPLSNPDIFPTGRNQYQYNPRKLPTEQAWEVGKQMAQQTIDIHRRRYGRYPSKLSITLWANTMIRTHGALEAEVLYLLGVEPVWNRRGDLEDVRLITPLGRPRIDVVMTVTGMYRDCFPEKILLLDKAVRLACDAPAESGQTNHLRLNTQQLARRLVGQGTSPEESEQLARLRIFGAQTGMYGTGVDGLVRASGRWTQRAQVADQYLERMSFAFSGQRWAQPAREVFEQQLRGVQAVIHGRSSNLYGIMDLTENFEYQGALAMAVEQLDGRQPDLYVNDFVTGGKVRSGREAVVLELVSRYHNPEFIRAMMDEGYDGARYLSRIADNQFGWDVVSDLITADDWKQYAEIYLDDKYQLGLRHFFEQHNPHALQNIASRILETHRKGLQQLDRHTLELAACTYVETLAQYGPGCASHICDNPRLNTLAEQLAGASGRVSGATLQRFRRQLEQTGNRRLMAARSASGASNRPAHTPQPVEGRVLTPAEPNRPRQSAGESAQRATAAATDRPAKSAAGSGTPETGEPKPSDYRMITLVIAVLCVLAFAFGMLRRAAGNRSTA